MFCHPNSAPELRLLEQYWFPLTLAVPFSTCQLVSPCEKSPLTIRLLPGLLPPLPPPVPVDPPLPVDPPVAELPPLPVLPPVLLDPPFPVDPPVATEPPLPVVPPEPVVPPVPLPVLTHWFSPLLPVVAQESPGSQVVPLHGQPRLPLLPLQVLPVPPEPPLPDAVVPEVGGWLHEATAKTAPASKTKGIFQ